MNKIVNFVNNMCYGLPKTKEVADLKANLIDSLEEKYQELINSGVNEQDAFARVIDEFGDAKEIFAQFKLDQVTPRQPINMEKRKAYGLVLSIAAAMYIFAPVMVILGREVFNWRSGLVASSFLIVVALATGLIIFNNFVNKQPKSDDDQYDPRSPKAKRLSDVASTLIMSSATIIFLVAGAVYGAWHPTWVVFPIGGLLSGVVSAVVRDM
jgi:hypothetical protein